MVVEVLSVGGMKEVYEYGHEAPVAPPWTSEVDLSVEQEELLHQGYMLEEVQ